MNQHETLSAYLVQPDLSRRRARQWAGFRSQLVEIQRYNPRILPRMAVALIIWGLGFAAVRYALTPHSLATSHNDPGIAAITGSPTLHSSVALAQVAHAQLLPTGPSGQLLPPGTMAPTSTYRNSYAWGQCTWYVAGRRPIPAGWGNADNWYYHAQDAGWAVGTAPAIAAVAWTAVGRYGHVALVEQISADSRQVYVSEMNYVGAGVKSYRWAPASSFKYIY